MQKTQVRTACMLHNGNSLSQRDKTMGTAWLQSSNPCNQVLFCEFSLAVTIFAALDKVIKIKLWWQQHRSASAHSFPVSVTIWKTHPAHLLDTHSS